MSDNKEKICLNQVTYLFDTLRWKGYLKDYDIEWSDFDGLSEGLYKYYLHLIFAGKREEMGEILTKIVANKIKK